MKKRNAEQTKELILNTAISLFAKNGFDGLRVDDLAIKAGVNKATIYYHFKDKNFIFEKILLDMSKLILEEIEKREDTNANPKKQLEAFLDAIIFIITTKRDLAKIMMQELAFNGKNLSDEAKKHFFKIIYILQVILKEGIKQKVFKDIDPFLIHATTIGSLNYYYTMKEAAISEENEEFKVDFCEDSADKIKEMILNYVLI
ncbi:transcriptional regulator, TetR family [Arcobacter nitrofigilis DSM 7299]|uniref:Transcriptional regulator, TetR family n=1 Tax=Arcobacter nitrofigilis (strain ATCC 33309 / DSM 7299 / CCUG 15893 / LMG 7604 / NCTC 12251 / CI) TaxID=572480 RepID=D5V404_ARCNC|nr:TetR/AcrR family transcriptional regulator [Arcobacter nitrofigilis]ADG92832.1 transcriptional regulator, TetR family [Arcobacter nitrofigilis DSM 7299]